MKKTNGIKRKLKRAMELTAFYFAVKIYKRRNNTLAIYRNLLRLNPIYHKRASYYYELHQLAYKQKKWKESLNHINKAIQQAENNISIEYYLAKVESLLKLNNLKEAKKCVDIIVKMGSVPTQYSYRLAKAQEKLNNNNEAIKKYESYLAFKPDSFSANVGLADNYYIIKDYQMAEELYTKILAKFEPDLKQETKIEIYYKLGMVQLENGEEEKSNNTFKKLMKMDSKMNSKKLGIGAIHQFYKNNEHAIVAYKNTLKRDNDNAIVLYNLATILEQEYRLKEAVEYYEEALKKNQIEANWHYQLAKCYTKLELHEQAVKWYKSASERSLKHSPTMYRYLAESLNHINKLEEALDAYKKADLFSKPMDISKKFYEDNIIKDNIRYGICYETYPVDENKIFYASMSGGGMMGNPYGIFEKLIEDENYREFTHVWLLNNFNNIPKKYRKMENIIFVKKSTDAYFKHQTSSKYLICDSTFEPYVIRKPNQYYLQTSHGIFYKTVGRDSSGSPLGVAGATRNLLQATHIIFPNDYMVKKQPRSYSIAGINSGEAAKVGYPRIDVTVNISQGEKERLSKQMKIDPTKKIVFYAPTWRGEGKASNRFDSDQLINDLKGLATLNANIVFRGHPISNALLKDVKLPSNILVPSPKILTNELLGISDILISDYSSVFFDFIVTERPIIHYLYDLDQYIRERGLNLTEDELPGEIAKTSKQLIESIKEKLVDPMPSERYLKAKQRFSTYDDGQSANRIIKWFIKKEYDDINIVKEERLNKSYLFLGGEFKNIDELPELVSHMNNLYAEGHRVSIMLERKVANDKERFNLISELNKNINLLTHDRKMSLTLEEAYADSNYKKYKSFQDNKMQSVYEDAYSRHARRLVGDSTFDEIINFEKDSIYWTSLEKALQKEHLVNSDN